MKINLLLIMLNKMDKLKKYDFQFLFLQINEEN
jgi:hypothetical protein